MNSSTQSQHNNMTHIWLFELFSTLHFYGSGWFFTWVSLEETDSLSSGSEGVKLAEIGVPGMPLAWTCSPSLPRVPSSSRELWVPSVTASADSDSAGSPSPLDSLVSEQRFVGSKQWPVVKMEQGGIGWVYSLNMKMLTHHPGGWMHLYKRKRHIY